MQNAKCIMQNAELNLGIVAFLEESLAKNFKIGKWFGVNSYRNILLSRKECKVGLISRGYGRGVKDDGVLWSLS